MPSFNGLVEIRNGDGDNTILLDGDTADITAGGNGQGGNLVVGDAAGAQRVSVDGPTGTVTISTPTGDPLVTVDGQEGDVVVFRKIGSTNREVFRFDASDATLTVGAQDSAGELVVLDGAGVEAMRVSGGNAALYVGASGAEGDIVVRDGAGRTVMHMNGQNAALYVGAEGNEGDIVVRDGAGRQVIHLESQQAALYVGASGAEGDIVVRDGGGRNVFHLNSDNGTLYVGVDGNEGDIVVRDGAGRTVFHLNGSNAALYVGAHGNEGDVIVRDGNGNDTIHLNGGNGDIILSNADAAEDFALAESVEAPPGSVMVLGGDGALRPCSTAYDRRVVGVVAGAGSRRPGIVLDRNADAEAPRVPISMMGKAACRVDTRYGSIEVGDLLTSSPSTGCAMRASDSHQAAGAVIGKALTPLDEGRGLVEMLISLQ